MIQKTTCDLSTCLDAATNLRGILEKLQNDQQHFDKLHGEALQLAS